LLLWLLILAMRKDIEAGLPDEVNRIIDHAITDGFMSVHSSVEQ